MIRVSLSLSFFLCLCLSLSLSLWSSPRRTPAIPRPSTSSWARWTKTTTGSWPSSSSGSWSASWRARRAASASRRRWSTRPQAANSKRKRGASAFSFTAPTSATCVTLQLTVCLSSGNFEIKGFIVLKPSATDTLPPVIHSPHYMMSNPIHVWAGVYYSLDLGACNPICVTAATTRPSGPYLVPWGFLMLCTKAVQRQRKQAAPRLHRAACRVIVFSQRLVILWCHGHCALILTSRQSYARRLAPQLFYSPQACFNFSRNRQGAAQPSCYKCRSCDR